MLYRVILLGLLIPSMGCDQNTGGQTMSDEQEIRDLFDNWIKATTEGNLALAHQCITEDALFLCPEWARWTRNHSQRLLQGV